MSDARTDVPGGRTTNATTGPIGVAVKSADGDGTLTGLSLRQRRQIAWITLGAIGIFALFRWLPTGTNLSHMDFRVDAKNPIDFCDPLNPQFIPVVAVASPVSMTLTAPPAHAGREVAASIRLVTASGKPIGPADLLVVHTEKLHLLIIDPTLTDYQHVHPAPGRAPGEWTFRFTPRNAGVYRIFADFTPAATARGLYANTDLAVGAATAAQGARSPAEETGSEEQSPKSLGPERGSAAPVSRLADQAAIGGSVGADAPTVHAIVVERDGYRFRLTPDTWPLRARTPVDLKFAIERPDDGRVPLQTVMGAYAHLVAFDTARSGFAHLHPTQIDLNPPPDAVHPILDFKIMIPKPGRYVIWSQINLAGREVFVPFWFDVT